MWPFSKNKSIELSTSEPPKTLAEKWINRELSEFWEHYSSIKLIDYEELDGDDIKLVGMEYMKDGSNTPPIIWVRVSGKWFFKQNPRYPAFEALVKSETNKMCKQIEDLLNQLLIKKKYGYKLEEPVGYGGKVYNPRNETYLTEL